MTALLSVTWLTREAILTERSEQRAIAAQKREDTTKLRFIIPTKYCRHVRKTRRHRLAVLLVILAVSLSNYSAFEHPEKLRVSLPIQAYKGVPA